ncbi:PASTA domain-containing protein, partial [Anaerorhabdus sp.]|uniref:PASTA domain-containing protein n=1 Tax=Anaerorhabdus sp. TaxID=1872524 RepID=UPI002FCA144D
KPSVENYTNKSKDSFNSYIEGLNKKSANLKVVVNEVNSDKTPGTILKQIINNKTVTGATTVDTGTTITIEIAKTETKDVPSYAGKSESTFKTEIVNTYKMKVGSSSSKYSDSISNGSIISNETGVKPIGTSINYVVSIGAFAYKDSDFVGKTKAQADSFVSTENNKGAGISLKANETFNDTVASGTLFGCSYSGKIVTCSLSKGKSITVPNYVGDNKKPCSTAACTVDGLKVTIKYIDSDKDADTVLDQSIKAGSNVAENTAITVTLSNGKNKKYCPTGSIGTYPNCSCSDGSEYDAVNNVCKVPTKGPLPIIDKVDFNGTSYTNIVDTLQPIYDQFKFTNVKFVKLNNSTTNPNNLGTGIKYITPEADGSIIEFNTYIEIGIFVQY